jgi:hypothetical protein
MEIEEGQEFWGVLAELCIDPETKRIRVRSLPNQVFPANIFIECSKAIRKKHAIGTIFKLNIGVSRKPIGRLYAHAKKKGELLTVPEWSRVYG